MNLLTTFYQNLMGVRQKKLDKSESCGTINEQSRNGGTGIHTALKMQRP